MKKTVWNWMKVVLLAVVSMLLWVGCRTNQVYVGSGAMTNVKQAASVYSADGQTASGSVAAIIYFDANQGKTVTTEAQLPVDEVAEIANPEGAAAGAVVDAVAGDDQIVASTGASTVASEAGASDDGGGE